MSMTAIELARRNTYAHTASGMRKTRVFIVSGANEPEEALTHGDIPEYGDAYADPQGSISQTLRVVEINARPVGGQDDRHEITVVYAYPPPERPTDPQDGDEFWRLRYGPRTVTKREALSQEKFGGDAREMGLNVNVDDAGRVQGLSAHEGYATLDVTLWKATADITEAYLSNITPNIPPVNSSTWYGFAAGTVLYGGYEMESRGADLTEIQFRFLCAPNINESDLPDWKDIDGTTISVTGGRKGWEQIWTQSGQKKGTAGGGDAAVAHYTRGVYRAGFYPEDSFSGLGLSGELFPGS